MCLYWTVSIGSIAYYVMPHALRWLQKHPQDSIKREIHTGIGSTNELEILFLTNESLRWHTYNVSQFIPISSLVSFDLGAENIWCWLWAISRSTEHSKWSQSTKCQLLRLYSLLYYLKVYPSQIVKSLILYHFLLSCRIPKISLHFCLYAFEEVTQNKTSFSTYKEIFLCRWWHVFEGHTVFTSRYIPCFWPWLTIQTSKEIKRIFFHPHNSYSRLCLHKEKSVQCKTKTQGIQNSLNKKVLIPFCIAYHLPANKVQDSFMM